MVFGNASGYTLTCVRAADRCTILQHRATRDLEGLVPLHAIDSAAVRVFPSRRGSPRIFLMLHTDVSQLFAVEYEGRGAEDQARAAARQFNVFLAHPTVPRLVLEVRHPILQAIAWVGVVLVAVVVVVGYRVVVRRVGRGEK
jgi:hypothetical protein